MIIEGRDGNGNVFQTASADSRTVAVVQISHGSVPHHHEPPGERGVERAVGCQSAGV